MDVGHATRAGPGVPRTGVKHPAPESTLTWRLYRGASAVRKQLRVTDGVIGFACWPDHFARSTRRCRSGPAKTPSTTLPAHDPHRDLHAHAQPDMGPTTSCDGRYADQTAGHHGTTRCVAFEKICAQPLPMSRCQYCAIRCRQRCRSPSTCGPDRTERDPRQQWARYPTRRFDGEIPAQTDG